MTKVSLEIERWLESVLSLSGINTKDFSAHSYRGASLSSAHNKEVSLNDILKTGDWTIVDTFINHYYGHASDIPVSQIILIDCTPECEYLLVSTFLILYEVILYYDFFSQICI